MNKRGQLVGIIAAGMLVVTACGGGGGAATEAGGGPGPIPESEALTEIGAGEGALSIIA